MEKPIPTHLILGFLGSGKTTAIIELLRQKPLHETWAVLVNEFGEVGIDGQLLSDQGAQIREVPGGCMCCVAGLPMQIGLNMLIQRAQPDRLLIEPTGLGHPHQILETLQSEFYREVLNIRACLGLVDPSRLENPRVLANENFQAQVTAADILLGNKADQCDESQKQAFLLWAEAQQPPKQHVHLTEKGRFPLDWLELPHGAEQPPAAHGHAHDGNPPQTQWHDLEEVPWQQALNQGESHYSCGWRIHPATRLDYNRLHALALAPQWLRFKGFLHTSRGWYAFNAVDGVVTAQPIPDQAESRLEIISDQTLDGEALDASLRGCADGNQ
mgnify:CR=1 FL=1